MEKFTGTGEYKYKDGSTYKGEWKEGMKHGDGIMLFANYDQYEGSWVEDKMEGQGTYLFWNVKKDKFGDKYVGHFKHGKREGIGQMFYADGGSYSGMWQNNMRTGEGLRIFTNGECFHGLWRFDKMLRGIYSLSNGDKYDGEIKENVFEGYGKYYWKDGSWYEGSWLKGKPYTGKKFTMAGHFIEYKEGSIVQ